MKILTVVIPCATINDGLTASLEFFLTLLRQQFVEKDFEVVLLAGSMPTSAPALPAAVRVIYSDTDLWMRLVSLQHERFNSAIVALLTADDIWELSKADIDNFLETNARVALGRFLCVKPINQRFMRVFRGWMQFGDYMSKPPTKERFYTYIGEAPVSVWAVYETSYFRRLLALVESLFPLLGPGNWNLLEDCINLVNLVQRTYFFEKSTCIRFFDSSHSSDPTWKLSVHCIADLSNRGRYDSLCSKLFEFLTSDAESRALRLDFEDVRASLLNHAIGYAKANSRKWRNWIDVDFYPFETVPHGVVLNGEPVHKFDVVYRMDRVLQPNDVFPSSSWLADVGMRDLFFSVPEKLWRDRISSR